MQIFPNIKLIAVTAIAWGFMMSAQAIGPNRITVLKTGPTVQVRSRFSDRYDVLIKLAPGVGGQINFAEVSFPASDAARYPDQGMLYYHWGLSAGIHCSRA